MNFYDREQETEKLRKIASSSNENAQMTFVVGRRRIGKTMLLLKALPQENTLYFFVARKSEDLLCQDFILEIQRKLNVPVLGNVSRFADVFNFLMQVSESRQFNLVIDEFQEFYNVNSSVYGEMQHYWDVNKEKSKINLVLCGSINSLMHKIFENSKEPLFGRATAKITVKPFRIDVIKAILKDHNPQYTNEDLLALYLFTGGVAKYIQLLIDNHATTFEKMVDFIICEDSRFIDEGKNMLIEEFGKDYATYFSILSYISSGKNTRSEIEAEIGGEIGGYLTKLERDYGLITKEQPILSKSTTKNMRYGVADNFLTFWFRFIYKYGYYIESANFDDLKDLVKRDYATFSGHILERYFRQQLRESQQFSRIGSYWDRKGTHEMDLIAIDDNKKQILFAEVKRNEEHIRYNTLKEKAEYFLSLNPKLKRYKKEYKGLSLKNL